ncbi:MBL fold metallo-hydrolase [Deinococcus cavernae]|uniref:MBL fold metallo-hydrolase n=1 Tax=Deinococcus cavernae TaxID=2320857 RepID=A0A418V0A9_9DEIO|nr:MBL fold metallo-hydrolase [Deinococcus cavernae]RJF69154.1 MBL fold metallo-hydrolase [Deinococcus cavernae]
MASNLNAPLYLPRSPICHLAWIVAFLQVCKIEVGPVLRCTVCLSCASKFAAGFAIRLAPETGARSAGLAQLGLKFSDVQRVMVTHHHPDHYGMAGLLEEAGAEIFVLDIEAESGLAYWRDWDAWLPKLLAQMHANGLPPEYLISD